MYNVINRGVVKYFRSDGYNYMFNRRTGLFVRYGKTTKDDPEFSPFGPELLDIEISTGDCASGCAWCYKSNTAYKGRHMSFETFKAILDKMPVTLTQVALGLTDLNANKDLIPILDYCIDSGIVPNFTTAGYGVTEALARECARYVGAVAVSRYPHNKEQCYNTIELFNKSLGIVQTNMHLLYYHENLDFVYQVFDEIQTDSRLSGLNAVVMLGLKPKGRAQGHFTPATAAEFAALVKYCLDRKLPIGFDSCSCCKFVKSLDTLYISEDEKNQYLTSAEPCESGLFSLYIDVNGFAWPCSFCENVEGIEPINVLACNDFTRDVWYADSMVEWRARLLKNGRRCPVYAIG